MNQTTLNTIRNNVMQASAQWISDFNQGNVQTCINRYLPSATMQVHPFGKFTSIEAITDFWLEFAKSNPSDLVYRNIEIKVLNDRQTVLSANWRMNIASGFISKELWTLAEDGQWYLEEDDFTVLAQHTKPVDDKRTALVLVDLQNDYFSGGRFELDNTDFAAKQASQLLAHFRQKELPVIHIQHLFEETNAAFFSANTVGAEIESSVKPTANEPVIIKHQIDSFIETTLEQTLIELGIDNLVIVGAMAQACVQTICRSAVNKGYKCQVISDAIAAPKLEYQQHSFTGEQLVAANLLSLSFGGADITDTKGWLQENS
ncbi:cysteine hydrolase family protein [Colwellia sp. Bg11-28]|uniref:cysteine hydrolase family protein n=1 Tax=Colwellia sp. Bg11-28 TaxID=2058305 RepID=UPI000C332E7C|nr:cysteine hydrolase family protein [Colwellia sp. Bg11-28]PKH86313.1 isochorismatase [Colwellia sp. Bg11-28]